MSSGLIDSHTQSRLDWEPKWTKEKFLEEGVDEKIRDVVELGRRRVVFSLLWVLCRVSFMDDDDNDGVLEMQ